MGVINAQVESHCQTTQERFMDKIPQAMRHPYARAKGRADQEQGRLESHEAQEARSRL